MAGKAAALIRQPSLNISYSINNTRAAAGHVTLDHQLSNLHSGNLKTCTVEIGTDVSHSKFNIREIYG
jgi:hypothetical protein